MHLSNEIQNRLDKLNSNVKLASMIDGGLADKYAIYNKSGRGFIIALASSDKEFSVVLTKRTNQLDYQYCFARGLFTNLDKLSSLINQWVDKQSNISEIEKEFEELELYVDFEVQNPNDDIDRAWTKIKNRIFNDVEFWMQRDWIERYLEMLAEAKKHKAFENYFPFTSLSRLMFTIDKDSAPLNTFIIPSVYSDEFPRTLGKFYVSFNDIPLGGQFFETAKEALDFYAEQLNAGIK